MDKNPRLIDADAWIADLEKVKAVAATDEVLEQLVSTVEKIQYMIDERAKRHPVEAEPVRHGRWIVNDLGQTHCSACGKRIPFFHCYSDEPCSDYDEEWDEEIPETPYCPQLRREDGRR